jgi:DNA-binding response OmpR family regulator
MRGLYIAAHHDPALLRALAECGYKITAIVPAETSWALTEDAGYLAIIHDSNAVGVDPIVECADLKADSCMLLAVLPADALDARRVALLRAGADACLRRPISFVELEAILQAFHRRGSQAVQAAPLLNGGGGSNAETAALLIDRSAHRASYLDQSIALSPQQFRLLRALADMAGRPLDRVSIWKQVWSEAVELNPKAIDIAVSRLRNKLTACSVEIIGVRGAGYRLDGRFRIR